MKVIISNETQTTVCLADGKLRLFPKGSPTNTDRKEVSEDIAKLPDVQRFKDQGKIAILSVEDAARKEQQEARASAPKKDEPPKVDPKSDSKPDLKPNEAKKPTEATNSEPEISKTKGSPVVEPKETPKPESSGKPAPVKPVDSSKSKKKRSGRN